MHVLGVSSRVYIANSIGFCWRVNRVNRDSNFRRFRESTLDIVEEKEIERRIR